MEGRQAAHGGFLHFPSFPRMAWASPPQRPPTRREPIRESSSTNPVVCGVVSSNLIVYVHTHSRCSTECPKMPPALAAKARCLAEFVDPHRSLQEWVNVCWTYMVARCEGVLAAQQAATSDGVYQRQVEGLDDPSNHPKPRLTSHTSKSNLSTQLSQPRKQTRSHAYTHPSPTS